MTKILYLDNSYLKEFKTKVKSVKDGKFVVLEETAFYPSSGGQPHDEGIIKNGEKDYKVIFVGKFSGEISHEVDHPGLKVGDEVSCTIDWGRRYRLMRMHTAAHLVSDLIHKKTGALITGNQLGIDKTRIDFNLEEFNREEFANYISEVNKIMTEGHEISISYMEQEEALKIPSMVKLANALPPAIKELRIVKIGELDMQADGGTHVKNTKEVGELEIVKLENKGKNNRRLYYKLKD